MRDFILNKQTYMIALYSELKRKGAPLENWRAKRITMKCRHCKKKLKLGDRVTTKACGTKPGGFPKRYHYQCAEAINIV